MAQVWLAWSGPGSHGGATLNLKDNLLHVPRLVDNSVRCGVYSEEEQALDEPLQQYDQRGT